MSFHFLGVVAVALATLSFGAVHGFAAEKTAIPSPDELVKKLPAGWRYVNCGSVVFFTCDKEMIYLFNAVAPFGRAPNQEEEIRKEGIRSTSYVIVWTITPRLSNVERSELLRLRDKTIRTAREQPAKDAPKGWDGGARWKFRIPQYYTETSDFHLHDSESGGRRLAAPSEVISERDTVLRLFTDHLERYETK